MEQPTGYGNRLVWHYARMQPSLPIDHAQAKSLQMARVRSKNTEPEIVVRQALHARGYRFRLHRKDLPGTPDIVLPKHRLAILVHGCFWHGCPRCDRGRRLPKTNAPFWIAKLTPTRNATSVPSPRWRKPGGGSRCCGNATSARPAVWIACWTPACRPCG